ncbi:hypothetical protein HOY82DRAFT_618979 [Tuber indicum]|nr:hypothetical protein HOY82DRAFT_618979 [Tuber indicum]
MLMDARHKALTNSNIKAAFCCTGIAPVNRRRVLSNPDLQNPIPLHQTHHNLWPLATNDCTASRITQLEEDLRQVDSVGRAWELGQELALLARTTSAQALVHEKRFTDELKKRKVSGSKAGAIITRAEVIGRKALDKAYKDKIARKEKAKKAAEIKKNKKEKKHSQRLINKKRVEDEGSELSHSEQEPAKDNCDGSRLVEGRGSQLGDCPSNGPAQRPLDINQHATQHFETQANGRRNPPGVTRNPLSFLERYPEELASSKV